MYKWIGKGVLRHGGKIVAESGDVIPNSVPEHTIKSLLKKGTAEKVAGPTEGLVKKAEAALAKANAAVAKTQAALEKAPESKKKAIATQLEKKETLATKAAETLEAVLEAAREGGA